MFDTCELTELWECKAIDANFIIDCAFGSILNVLFAVTIYRAAKRKSLRLLGFMSGILMLSVTSIMIFTILLYKDIQGNDFHIVFRNYSL